MANLPMENFHGIEVVFMFAGPVGLLAWLLRMISVEESDRVIQVLLQSGIFLLTLNMLEKTNDSRVWWFVIVLGILSYTALQSFSDAHASDDASSKADYSDVEKLRDNVEELRDNVEELRDEMYDLWGEPQSLDDEMENPNGEQQSHNESDDANRERQGQGAELRNLRDEIEELKEEMAFLRAAWDGECERSVLDKKSWVAQTEEAHISSDELTEAKNARARVE